MSEPYPREKFFPVVGVGEDRPPDYGRLARSLSDADLADEIRAGNGTSDYQAELAAERARRKEKR